MNRSVYALALFSLLLCASRAHADPLIVTNGTVNVTPISFFTFTNISGAGFSLSGLSVGGGSNPLSALVTCPCTPGQAVNLNDTISAFHSGGVAVNGVGYGIRNPFGPPPVPGEVNLQSTLQFTTPNFALPFSQSSFTLSVPVILTGSLRGTNFGGVVLFDETLYGQGIATVLLSASLHNGGVVYTPTQLTYTFTTPTPEPATMILFGTGLAGIVATARRRRRTSTKV